MFDIDACCACSACKSDSRDFLGSELSAASLIDDKVQYDGSSVVHASGNDIPGDLSTDATIAIGGSVIGELEAPGDTDWYRIELTEGETISISLEGSGSSPVSDTFLRIYDSNGELLASNDDGGVGVNSLMRFTAGSTGSYYIEADSYDGTDIGEYTLSVSIADPLELYSVDQIVDQLTSGYWGGNVRSFNVGADGAITIDVTALSEDEQFLARQALLLWSDVTGIAFNEVSSNAEITFTNTGSGAYASSSRSGSTITRSTVNIEASWIQAYGVELDGFNFQTYIHEIGHALGLGHAGNYNGDASYANDALYLNDSWSTTIMSYFDQSENSYFSQLGFSEAAPTSPMMADVAAMAELYGLSTTTRLGDTVYGFNSTSDRAIHDATQFADTAYTIVDSGGYDTLDYSQFSADQLIDLNPESFMNIGGLVGNVAIGRGTVIEAAIGGSGNDTIYGNSAVNELRGNAGNDTIEGGSGSDNLYGGTGNDTLYGQAGWDFLFGEGGSDTLWGGNGGDRLYGGAGDDTLHGEDHADRLYGEDGNDTIFGGSGNDTIHGGDGNDRLNGGLDNDYIAGGSGSDWLSGDAGDDVLLGGAGWDTLIGSSGADELSGGNGNDVLVGGFGVDTVTGGAGSDTFVMEMFGESNMSIITDFEAGIDEIRLDRSVGFGELSWGKLAAGAFNYGWQATEADDRIIYQWSTGKLFYDPDGVGGEQAYLFAQVDPQTPLNASHFFAFGPSMPPPTLAEAQDKLMGADDFVV